MHASMIHVMHPHPHPLCDTTNNTTEYDMTRQNALEFILYYISLHTITMSCNRGGALSTGRRKAARGVLYLPGAGREVRCDTTAPQRASGSADSAGQVRGRGWASAARPGERSKQPCDTHQLHRGGARDGKAAGGTYSFPGTCARGVL